MKAVGKAEEGKKGGSQKVTSGWDLKKFVDGQGECEGRWKWPKPKVE